MIENGGIIGKIIVPNNNTGSGMWNLYDVSEYVLGDTWPKLVTSLYQFTNATFTPGTSVGTTGPSLSQAISGLSGPEVDNWKNNTQFFNVTNGKQFWTCPISGSYRFTIAGAKGGDAQPGTNNVSGSPGRKITFDVNLIESQIIEILIGQSGTTATLDSSNGAAGGGGGGTYILINGSFIAVSGGGGGAGSGGTNRNVSTSGTAGQPYNITNGSDGTETSESWNPFQPGGTNGGGGQDAGSGGAGGGGINGDGIGNQQYAGFGGKSYSNGSAGGGKIEYSGTSTGLGAGGFGGGGGAGYHNNYEVIGGGGGGYSGGGGGATRVGGGGGGGSFLDLNSATFISESLNYSSGFVTISVVN